MLCNNRMCPIRCKLCGPYANTITSDTLEVTTDRM